MGETTQLLQVSPFFDLWFLNSLIAMFHVHLTSHTQKSKPYLICKTQTIDPPNKLLRFPWIVWKVGMEAEFLLNSFSCSHLKGDNSTLLSGLCFFCTTPFKSSLNPLCSPDFNFLSKCLGELTAACLNQKFCQFLDMMGEGRSISLLKASSYSVCSPVIFRTVVFNRDYPTQ